MSVTRYYQLSNGLLTKTAEHAKEFGIAATFVLASDYDALRQAAQEAARALQILRLEIFKTCDESKTWPVNLMDPYDNAEKVLTIFKTLGVEP